MTFSGIEFTRWPADPSILTGRCSGRSALEAWRRLSGTAKDFGFCPVLVGDEEEAERAAEMAETRDEAATPDDVLRIAEHIDAERWIAERYEELFDGEDDEWLTVEPPEEDDEEAEDETPSSATDADDEFLESLEVHLLPSEESWQAPALRPFGGYAGCPTDAEHVAVLRRWHAMFGTRVLSMTGDTIELILPAPVSDPEVAARVACEMVAYAPAIVTDGTETVQALAEDLMGRRIWFFWWPS